MIAVAWSPLSQRSVNCGADASGDYAAIDCEHVVVDLGSDGIFNYILVNAKYSLASCS